MTATLTSPARRIAFAAACAVVLCAYVYVCTRMFVAHRYSLHYDQASLRKAVALEPSNAAYWYALGRYNLIDRQDMPAALDSFRHATALNPYVGRYWLDTATVYETLGDPQQQLAALNRALAAEPTTPDVAWDVANFDLVRGDNDAALRAFHNVILNAPDQSLAALYLCWRATGDVDKITALALPPSAEAYQVFVLVLLNRGEVAAARRVWQKMMDLHQPYSLADASVYIDYMLNRGESDAAQAAWQQLIERNPNLRDYQRSPDNLMVNAQFDSPLLNAGFDWRYVPVPAVSLGLDTTTFRSGHASLLLTFQGSKTSDAGVFQIVPAKPNTLYDFSAWIKTEDMIGAEGPRLRVSEFPSGQPLFTSDDFLGDNTWKEVQAQFKTLAGTHLLKVSVIRTPKEDSAIKGKFWLDSVSLSEVR